MSKNWHKWHLNRKTGEVGECHADKKPCPFGGDENHFPSRIGAIYAYEEQQRREGNLFTELKSKKENPHYDFANEVDRLEQEQVQVDSWADATDEDLAEMTDFYETEEAARQAWELSQKKRPISSRLEEADKKRRETPFEWPTGGPPPF